MAFIEMKKVSKSYRVGESLVHANRDVSFDINQGELVVILGASGAGKSTVLNILGGMDTADDGHVFIDGKDIVSYNSRALTAVSYTHLDVYKRQE